MIVYPFDPGAAALTAAGVEVGAIDPDDVYSKYEASGSEWFQIAH